MVVSSLKQLRGAVLSRGIAPNLYVWSLIPQLKGAPSIPIMVDSDANDFTFEQERALTLTLLHLLHDRGIKAWGGVSDGDARLRKLQLWFCFHDAVPDDSTTIKHIRVEHPWIQLAIPILGELGAYLQTPDWMHIDWRLRTNYLSPTRVLTFGLMILSRDHLDGPALGLHAPDTNYKEKQHWSGLLRLCGLDASGHQSSEILEKMAEKHPADAQYWRFVSYYTRVFINSDDGLEQKVSMCGYVLAYLALWRWQCRRNKQDKKQCFITNQTFLDVVISVSLFILQLRLASQDGMVGDTFRFLVDRQSSRFMEYLFAFCRSEHAKATSFGAYSGLMHIKHFIWVRTWPLELSCTSAT